MRNCYTCCVVCEESKRSRRAASVVSELAGVARQMSGACDWLRLEVAKVRLLPFPSSHQGLVPFAYHEADAVADSNSRFYHVDQDGLLIHQTDSIAIRCRSPLLCFPACTVALSGHTVLIAFLRPWKRADSRLCRVSERGARQSHQLAYKGTYAIQAHTSFLCKPRVLSAAISLRRRRPWHTRLLLQSYMGVLMILVFALVLKGEDVQ